jgi:tight adherence protein B
MFPIIIIIFLILSLLLFFLAIPKKKASPKDLISSRLLKESKKEKRKSIVLKIIEQIAPKSYLKQTDLILLRANIPLTAVEFLGLKIFAFIFLLLAGISLKQEFVMSTFVGLAGFLFPTLMIKNIYSRRQKKFNGQLADALNLIVTTLRSGFSFMQSLKVIATDMPAPISEEFGRLLQEVNLGLSLEDAFNNLTRITESQDLDLVATCVLIQSEAGGNLAEILEKVSQTIRERFKIQGDVRALTAQGRFTGWMIGFLPVILAFLINLINPGYITILFTHPIGKIMILTAIIMESLGAFIIKKIVTIET